MRMKKQKSNLKKKNTKKKKNIKKMKKQTSPIVKKEDNHPGVADFGAFWVLCLGSV